MIRLGVAIEETWSFFNEIYADLQAHYQTELFERKTWNVPVFHSRINQLLYRQALTAFLKDHDVVFFEWASNLLAAATHLPKTCGIVARLHRYEMYQWVNRINWQAVDKLIVVSQAKKVEFAGKFPELAEKIVVSSPSTSLSKFQPQPRSFNGDIGILCNISPRKRVYDLILNFYELTRVREHVHLHIAGGMDPAFEDYAYSIHDLVNRLQLNDKVTFYGHLNAPADWYHGMDIFISNSYSEGLQVALMEAMASGCYCLSHWWSGAEEMLPEENLFLGGNELQSKILGYIDRPEVEKLALKDQMRSIACQKFDINQTIAQIKQTIDAVAGSRGGSIG